MRTTSPCHMLTLNLLVQHARLLCPNYVAVQLMIWSTHDIYIYIYILCNLPTTKPGTLNPNPNPKKFIRAQGRSHRRSFQRHNVGRRSIGWRSNVGRDSIGQRSSMRRRSRVGSRRVLLLSLWALMFHARSSGFSVRHIQGWR